MSNTLLAGEFENPYEAYKTAKARQAGIEEIVKIKCTPEESAEIMGVFDEDCEDCAKNDDSYEMWGTTHTQAGSYEWRIHLIPA